MLKYRIVCEGENQFYVEYTFGSKWKRDHESQCSSERAAEKYIAKQIKYDKRINALVDRNKAAREAFGTPREVPPYKYYGSFWSKVKGLLDVC